MCVIILFQSGVFELACGRHAAPARYAPDKPGRMLTRGIDKIYLWEQRYSPRFQAFAAGTAAPTRNQKFAASGSDGLRRDAFWGDLRQ